MYMFIDCKLTILKKKFRISDFTCFVLSFRRGLQTSFSCYSRTKEDIHTYFWSGTTRISKPSSGDCPGSYYYTKRMVSHIHVLCTIWVSVDCDKLVIGTSSIPFAKQCLYLPIHCIVIVTSSVCTVPDIIMFTFITVLPLTIVYFVSEVHCTSNVLHSITP